MPEIYALVRAATLSYEDPGQPGRKYPRELIELSHGIVFFYFINPINCFSRYEKIDEQELEGYRQRLDKAGARAMHLTPEESQEVCDSVFGARDSEKISRFLCSLTRRIEKAGLKGSETASATNEMRRGKLFGS